MKLSRLSALAAAITCATLGISVAPALAAPPVALSGAYTGAANASGLTDFASWRGAPATLAVDFLGYNDWSSLQNPSWWLNGWQSFTADGGTLVLSVPMLTTSGDGTLADGAAGDYDSYYQSLATQLVAAGDASTIIRLGWEFNGTWYPWSISDTNSADSPANFVAYWQRIVTLMRAVPGSNFKFVWTVNPGPEPVQATEAYPGNAYVDYVGVDVYDQGYGADGAPIASDSDRWNQIANQQYGLNWWNNFAKQQGKPLALPEWGLDSATNGGGDDPYFIEQMWSWMEQNKPAFESYFYNDGTLTSGSEPQAAAEYQTLWSDANTSTQLPSSSPTTPPSTQTSSPSKTTQQPARSTKKLVSTKKATKRSKPAKRGRGHSKHRHTEHHRSHRSKAKPGKKRASTTSKTVQI